MTASILASPKSSVTLFISLTNNYHRNIFDKNFQGFNLTLNWRHLSFCLSLTDDFLSRSLPIRCHRDQAKITERWRHQTVSAKIVLNLWHNFFFLIFNARPNFQLDLFSFWTEISNVGHSGFWPACYLRLPCSQFSWNILFDKCQKGTFRGCWGC